MSNFGIWWNGLTPLNQAFFGGAGFFSVLFVWQLIMAFIGMDFGGHDMDTHVEPATTHDTPHDANDASATFKLLSVRSVLAFCTIFTWAGALYLRSPGLTTALAMTYAILWGLLAMVLVAMLLRAVEKMAETGSQRLEDCVGSEAVVYLDIPAHGTGEIRLLCNGVMTLIKARMTSGGALKAGASVRIVRLAASNTAEVEPAGNSPASKEKE
jgi:membrane protein implicated in regulation of membrane protease activity